jgi:anti-sigma factor RsiW
MACTRYVTSIQELVDGTLGPIRAADLEAHLETCEACRALRADLEAIRDAAGTLGDLPVPDRTWLQIAGRLRQEGRIQDLPEPRRGLRPGHYALFAAAAGLIAAIGVSLVLLSGARTPAPAAQPPTAQATAQTPATFESVQNEVDQAQTQMETAISHMEQITKANTQALDSKTAATLEKNLGILDQAIAENRAAVKSEPTSVAARSRLFETLKQKVSLLQDTIALMNEMRKGNNAGAAQIVEGLNKSS